MSMQPLQPLNPGAAATQVSTGASDQPVRKVRPRAPKLTLEGITAPSTVAALFTVGRATAAEYTRLEKQGGYHARLLGSTLRRAARWAQSVAPQHSLSQFVVEARALSSRRDVRARVSDIRLAQLRGADVVDAAADSVNDTGVLGGSDPAEAGAECENGGAVTADVPDDVFDLPPGGDGAWDEPDDMLDDEQLNVVMQVPPPQPLHLDVGATSVMDAADAVKSRGAGINANADKAVQQNGDADDDVDAIVENKVDGHHQPSRAADETAKVLRNASREGRKAKTLVAPDDSQVAFVNTVDEAPDSVSKASGDRTDIQVQTQTQSTLTDRQLKHKFARRIDLDSDEDGDNTSLLTVQQRRDNNGVRVAHSEGEKRGKSSQPAGAKAAPGDAAAKDTPRSASAQASGDPPADLEEDKTGKAQAQTEATLERRGLKRKFSQRIDLDSDDDGDDAILLTVQQRRDSDELRFAHSEGEKCDKLSHPPDAEAAPVSPTAKATDGNSSLEAGGHEIGNITSL